MSVHDHLLTHEKQEQTCICTCASMFNWSIPDAATANSSSESPTQDELILTCSFPFPCRALSFTRFGSDSFLTGELLYVPFRFPVDLE